MYTTSSVVEYTRSRILSNPSFNVYRGGQSVKFGLDLWHHSSLSRSSLETKQRVGTKMFSLVYSNDEILLFPNMM